MSNLKPIPKYTPKFKTPESTLRALQTHPLIIGVDPGLGGAVCVLNPLRNKIEHLINVPTFKIPTKSKFRRSGFTRYLDAHRLAMEIDIFSNRVAFAVIEETNAAPGDGTASAFKFGLTSGQIQGVLAANYLPVFPIKPRVWKLTLGLNSDKQTSIDLASKQWPLQKHYFKRKKDHDKAEAALLALYGFWHIKL